VDANWPDGDFVTPATLHRGGLTVAVSTGGRSCRQARMVKDTLDRHIRALETAELLVLGTSHEELPLERREAIQPVGARLAAAGGMLMQVWGLHEFMLLTTCNRVELVAVASVPASASGLLERIMGLEGLREGEWYRRTGYAAFEHLALVAAGMRSQAPGEYHVAAQVKSALDTAVRNGWAAGLLHGWVASALHLSKHIKNEVTPLLLTHSEVEDVSVAYLAETKGGDWSGHTVMVLGTGLVGRVLVDRALERNARCVWCYHVNRPELDPAWGGRVRLISLNEMKDALAPCDIVFCAMETAGAVLHAAHAPFFDQERRVVIVDLGVPRNVSPALLPLLPEADLVNLDRLKAWAARTYGSLDRALATSRAIVEQHRNEYESLVIRLQGRNQTQ
jgi:glutamyl-tRNA reductase